VYNLANGISVARLLSGPVMAGLIIDHQWLPALALLGLAGVSDWLDGYVARRYAIPSVLGSYLDPLADKVFVGCAVGALVYEVSARQPPSLCADPPHFVFIDLR
jgi:cardiolipin synthase (CMP-forming)